MSSRSLFAPDGAASTGDAGILTYDSTSGLVQVVRDGDAAPNGVGVFDLTGGVAFNESGQIAFRSDFSPSDGGIYRGIYRGGGAGPVERIARTGDVGPDGDVVFTEFIEPALNDAGQTAFLAGFRSTSSGFENRGIFRNDDTTGLTEIVRGGDAPPGDPTSQFLQFIFPALNNSGEALFVAGHFSTTLGTFGSGLYRGDSPAGLVEIIREGDPVPRATAPLRISLT